METLSILAEDIEIGERHRALSDDAVTRLAESMKAIGLRQPITIRIVDMMVIDGREVEGVPVLVAGRHRLSAAIALGWSHIDCIEVDDDAVEAEMWEIAENLHRLDLTKEQRDEHIRRYAELLGQRATIPQQNAAVLSKRGPGQPKAIPRQIAEETGLSVDTVRRALNPKPREIVSVKEAESDEEAVIREANTIVAAWNRARQEARDLAMSIIDEPVFDRTRAAA
jgi:ParB-like chromosome segregation protein Spo0J